MLEPLLQEQILQELQALGACAQHFGAAVPHRDCCNIPAPGCHIPLICVGSPVKGAAPSPGGRSYPRTAATEIASGAGIALV